MKVREYDEEIIYDYKNNTWIVILKPDDRQKHSLCGWTASCESRQCCECITECHHKHVPYRVALRWWKLYEKTFNTNGEK